MRNLDGESQSDGHEVRNNFRLIMGIFYGVIATALVKQSLLQSNHMIMKSFS